MQSTRPLAFSFSISLAMTVTMGVASLADQQINWPQWRGPHANGISDVTDAPVSWSHTEDAKENVLWRLPMPGPAGATPIVWGDRIFLTSVGENKKDLLLLCADTKGSLLWTRKVGQGNKAVRGDEGNFASPSPSTDGEHVWTFMSNGLLACYDFDGNPIWKKDLQKQYGTFDIQFGLSSTPVLHGDLLYVQLIHGPWNKDPHVGLVVALNKMTGEEVCAHRRVTDAVDECKHSYASPTLYDDGEQSFLLSHGADYVIAHDLKTGEELWRCGDLNPKGSYNSTLRFVASPAAAPGLIVDLQQKTARSSPSGLAAMVTLPNPKTTSPGFCRGTRRMCRRR